MDQLEADRKDKNKKPSNDKYLGSKFRTEMNRLMTELAGCECHYVRCLKPNEQKKKEYFVPTFVFQQIRYLGILDTIRVRKEGYPIRKKFRDFFLRFEDVCFWVGKKPRFEYEKIEDEASFKDLALKALDIMCPKRTKQQVLIGTARVFMKAVFYAQLERDRTQKMKIKEDASKKIAKVWFGSRVRRKIKRIRKGGSYLVKWYKVQKFKLKLMKMRYNTKIIQSAYKALLVRRKIKHMRKLVILIQSFVRMKLAKNRVKKIKRNGRFINRYMRIFLRRFKIQRKNKMKKIVLSLVDHAWFMIMNKIKVKYAVHIQKHVRGFLTKCKNWSKVQHGRKKKHDFLATKACHIIQKVYRGFKIRQALRIAQESANRIQGFWRMQKLYALIQEMRKYTIILQRNIKVYLTRTKAINKRLNEFFRDEQPYLDKNFYETSKLLFPHVAEFNEKDSSTFFNDKNFFIEDEFNKTKRKHLKVSLLPEHSPYGEPKIVLFAKVLDIDFLIDANEIYDKLWASEFEKLYNINIKNGNPIQQITVGGCHSMVLNNKGILYSWGWNNYGQCGVPSHGNIEI